MRKKNQNISVKRHHMRRFCVLIAAVAALLFFLSIDNTASAAVIPDTARCLSVDISISDGTDGKKLRDANYATTLTLNAGTEIVVESSTAMQSVYIIWDSLVPEWELRIGDTGYTFGTNGFLHEYLILPEPATQFTIIIPDSSEYQGKPGAVSDGMRIADIYAFGDGEIPDWVQQWQPVCSDADILFFPTHSDDEQLFFGAILPVYAAERQMKVQVAYFTQHWGSGSGSQIREHEKLNGIWYAGAEYYPILGEFADSYSETLARAEASIPLEDAVKFVTQSIRQTHPLVVVTHDLNGEYKHGQHMLVAQATIEAISCAADGDYDTESANQYGTWRTPKLYIHLYEDADTVLDMRTPLEAFDGETALEVAADAYRLYESQQKYYWFQVSDTAKVYRPAYGLYRSLVGQDVSKDDLMENIPEDREQLRGFLSGESVIPIYDTDDLLLLQTYPYGNFILMNDLDLSGIEWTPAEFYGTLDGNGKALLNLTINTPGTTTVTVQCPSAKEYEAEASGLFSVMEGASVCSLRLLGLNISVQTADNCFIGGIAGCSKNAAVSNCSVSGNLTLSSEGTVYGLGGLLGYSESSTVSDSAADLTAVCTGTGTEWNGQYFGGACALGGVSLQNCTVHTAGYLSRRSSTYAGGLLGFCIQNSTDGKDNPVSVIGNEVQGAVTFYGDITGNKPDYDSFIGENKNKNAVIRDNAGTVSYEECPEEFDVTAVLSSVGSENPQWETEEHPAEKCSEFSYTTYRSKTYPEYCRTADYCLPEHDLTLAETITAASLEAEGFGRYVCGQCGQEVFASIPKISADESTDIAALPAVEDNPEEQAETKENRPDTKTIFRAAAIVLLAGAAMITVVIFAFGALGQKEKEKEEIEKEETEAQASAQDAGKKVINNITAVLLLVLALGIAIAGIFIAVTCTGRETVNLSPLPDPMITVNQFFDGICKEDYESAYTCLEGYDSIGLENEPEEECAAALWEILRSNITWKTASACTVSGNTASIEVVITSPDLQWIAEEVENEVNASIEQYAEMSTESEDVYDGEGHYNPEFVETVYAEVFFSKIGENNYPTQDNHLTVSLIFSESEWKIVSDKALFSAFMGGIA